MFDAPDTPLHHTPIFWIIFNVAVLLVLALDMGVFHRKVRTITVKEAIAWSFFWVTTALAFNLFVYWLEGPKQALDFLTGYTLEKSLSIDNVFVFAIVFKYFHIRPAFQYRVLFYGVLGALVMRAGFIFAGLALLEAFSWMLYVFGGILILTGIKLAIRQENAEINPEANIIVRLTKRFFRVTPEVECESFFVKKEGKWWVTRLFLCLLVIETTDLIFAIDSIPAILAITQDSFIVYTSNVFAILGLRSLYFALAGIMELFHYLHYGLAFILCFVGIKMIISGFWHFPTGLSLAIIIGTVAVSIAASYLFPKQKG